MKSKLNHRNKHFDNHQKNILTSINNLEPIVSITKLKSNAIVSGNLVTMTKISKNTSPFDIYANLSENNKSLNKIINAISKIGTNLSLNDMITITKSTPSGKISKTNTIIAPAMTIKDGIYNAKFPIASKTNFIANTISSNTLNWDHTHSNTYTATKSTPNGKEIYSITNTPSGNKIITKTFINTIK